MTDRTIPGRLVDGVVAAVGLLALVVLSGLSLLAGLFLFVPVVFLGILVRTAVQHYAGTTDPGGPDDATRL